MSGKQTQPALGIEKENVYAESRKAGHLVDSRLQVMFVIVITAFAIVAIGLIMPQHLFDEGLHSSGANESYSLAWFAKDLQANITALFGLATGNEESAASVIGTLITYGVIIMAGAGLALCGALYQTTFRNALVTPSSLGVMSGAMLGMGVWVVFFFKESENHGLWFEDVSVHQSTNIGFLDYLWQSYGLAFCSLIGCGLVVGLVLLAVRLAGGKSASGIMMIVVGQVIGGVLGAVLQTIRYYYVVMDPEGEKAQMLMQLQISSFYRTYTVVDLALVGVPLLLLFAFVMAFRRQLTLLTFTEAEARTMGVETQKIRYLVIVLATLLTAVIVSFCGRVGFVGFIVPHLARRLVGPQISYLMPASFLLGGVFVLGAYVLINIVLGGAYSTMAGMFISIGGALVFLFTVLRDKEVTGGKL